MYQNVAKFKPQEACKQPKRSSSKKGVLEIHLVREIVFHDHMLVDDLDRNILSVFRVYRQLNLGEGAFSDRPTDLVLSDGIDIPHLSPSRLISFPGGNISVSSSSS